MQQDVFGDLGRRESRSTLLRWENVLKPVMQGLERATEDCGLELRLRGGCLASLTRQVISSKAIPEMWYMALVGAPIYGFEIYSPIGEQIAHLNPTITPWEMNVKDPGYVDLLHPILDYLADQGIGCRYISE